MRGLPDDVLHLVLEQCLAYHYSACGRLKANLWLLAVCQRWRRVALAAVYSEVFINHDSGGGDDDGENVHENSRPQVATNLDLVVSAGCVRMVKKVVVGGRHPPNPLPDVGAAIRLLRAAATEEGEWDGVQALELSLDLGSNRFYGDGISAAEHEDAISQASAALAAMMPRVVRLILGGARRDPVTVAFYGRLAGLYAGRLRALAAQCPIAVAPDCVFRRLCKAQLFHDSQIVHGLPRMDPGSLCKLVLHGWPTAHPWAAFGVDGSAGDVEFPALRTLNVAYYTGDPLALGQDARPGRLRFPRLERLSVQCMQDSCPLLERAVLPAHMEDVAIECPAPVLQAMSTTAFPATTGRLKLVIRGQNHRDAGVLTVANRFLAGARRAVLDVQDQSLAVLPETIACTTLTRLVIKAPVGVDTMLALIARHTNLAMLGLWLVAFDGMQADLSLPEAPGAGCVVEPLRTRIQAISINVNQRSPLWTTVVPLAKFLLLKVPTLTWLGAIHVPEKPIVEFVAAHSQWYPHLAGVQLKLNDSDNPLENASMSNVTRPSGID
ncbi:hypothetical protein H4R18_005860 [Coemansia javaensis]|uniref:F-box domain-containing protein n=1 Tax=Coemansia javaensis TaxID=2761396 RepID=A0A9W8LE81_9FUNG|nr:hypothetical protein H4R18_005860 [Coemansia javaensis]